MLSPIDIANLFDEAFITLMAQASAKPKGFRSSMPDVVRDWQEAYGYNKVEVRVIPSDRAITALDRCLAWTMQLEPRDRTIVWARASHRVPWKAIAKRLNRSEASVRRYYQLALYQVAEWANAGQ